MIKCIAGITTYNPRYDRLYDNVKSIFGQVDKVLIVDNHSDNINEIFALKSKFTNIEIIFNDSNYGIAFAMNIIGAYAKKNNYEWFMTLDQDSVCPINLIEEYSKYVDSSIGIISPYISFNQHFLSQLLGKNRCIREEESFTKKKYVLYAVSSGQLIQTKAWEECHGFWNYLFIDYVDQELCFHMTKLGYKILQVKSCELLHEPGIEAKVLGIKTAKQNAMREYYCARNSRLVYWVYKKEYTEAIRRTPFILSIKRIANVILIKEKIPSKIKAICLGVVDAYRWKHNYLQQGRRPTKIENRRRY